MKVSDLLMESSHEWNIPKVRDLLPEHAEEILGQKLSIADTKDSYIWPHTNSGTYNVKSGYYAAISTQQSLTVHAPPLPPISWLPDIWQCALSPKVKMFLWKCSHDAIPTGVSLVNRGIHMSGACKRCGEPETVMHILFQCRFAQETWALAPLHQPERITHLNSFPEVLKCSKDLLCLPPTGLSCSPLLPWICWTVWCTRNKLVFENRSFSPKETVTKAIAAAREWQDAQVYSQESHHRVLPQQMQNIPYNSLLCFSDGAWKEDTKIAGLGWLTNQLNDDGTHTTTHKAAKKELHVNSALVAEALALREAVHHSVTQGHWRCVFFSDSQRIITALKAKITIKEIAGILNDIYLFIPLFSSIEFRFIPRLQNQLADSLAKTALRGTSDLPAV